MASDDFGSAGEKEEKQAEQKAIAIKEILVPLEENLMPYFPMLIEYMYTGIKSLIWRFANLIHDIHYRNNEDSSNRPYVYDRSSKQIWRYCA